MPALIDTVIHNNSLMLIVSILLEAHVKTMPALIDTVIHNNSLMLIVSILLKALVHNGMTA